MRGVEVILPGGLPNNGNLERKVRFRPLTGELEHALIEMAEGSDRPAYVTAVLEAVLDSIGGLPAITSTIENLCVADRQYLMLHLSILLGGEHLWLNATCSHCKEFFDIDIHRDELPIKPAGQGYPQVNVKLGGKDVGVRVPTGADQGHVVNLSDQDAVLKLLQNCIHTVDGKPPAQDFIANLSQSEIETIDTALDEASPAVCNQLVAHCPECGQEQYPELDHYALTGVERRFFYDEIHTLASHYHWSEEEILNLPRDRRRLYLDLINRSAAVIGQGLPA